jgi:hypothetical protein
LCFILLIWRSPWFPISPSIEIFISSIIFLILRAHFGLCRFCFYFMDIVSSHLCDICFKKIFLLFLPWSVSSSFSEFQFGDFPQTCGNLEGFVPI